MKMIPAVTMNLIGTVVCSLVISYAAPAFSHGGGLNAEGCHNNRKTGDYHCHRSPSAEAPKSQDRPKQGSSTPYANCTAARAAGAAPVMQGEPGFGPHLDRDNDGIGCE